MFHTKPHKYKHKLNTSTNQNVYKEKISRSEVRQSTHPRTQHLFPILESFGFMVLIKLMMMVVVTVMMMKFAGTGIVMQSHKNSCHLLTNAFSAQPPQDPSPN